MFLKRLELYGFKTFSRKTQIEFPHGFLAVVGPNGSGKSNLTDAIRFCLGESNVKALRATRLDELVFAGTPTRNPAPYAEVTAVFDNSDSKLPVDLSEVSITRRLTPDGGSKFQINGTNCRLKDVHELLMGSGIGPGSFSVLGGKEVDRVLSSDPKDRRLMLEETAGVNRYRFRKKEAQRRLNQTENNLTRLRDILKEVEDQLAESKRQLQRYERYKRSQDELKTLDRKVAFHELSILGEQKTELEGRTQQAQDELEAARERERSTRLGLEELRQQKAQVDLERERSSSEMASLREQTGATRAAHEGIFRRARELEHNARTAMERLESSDQRIDQQSRRLQELEQRNPELEQQLSKAQAEVDRLQVSLGELPAPGQGPNAELRVRLSQLEKQKDKLLNKLSSLEARLDDRLRPFRDLSQKARLFEFLFQFAPLFKQPLTERLVNPLHRVDQRLSSGDELLDAFREILPHWAELAQHRKQFRDRTHREQDWIYKKRELDSQLENRFASIFEKLCDP